MGRSESEGEIVMEPAEHEHPPFVSAPPETRHKAGRAVAAAVKSGVLVRGPCRDCGKTPADGHHHKGYAPEHWLDVIWLCRRCHLAEHLRLRGPRALAWVARRIGRPGKAVAQRVARFNTSLRPATLRALDDLAEKKGLNRSQMIQHLLVAEIQRRGIDLADKRFDPPKEKK